MRCMKMLMLAAAAAGAFADAEPWREVAVAESGHVIAVVSERITEGVGGPGPSLWATHIDDADGAADLVRTLVQSRYGDGPGAWGLLDDDLYIIQHSIMPDSQGAAGVASRGRLDDYLLVLRSMRDNESPGDALHRCIERTRQRRIVLDPMKSFYEHPAEDLRERCTVFYDLAFMDGGDGCLFIQCGGWLRWYSFDDAAEGSNRKFTREGGVESSMTGAFRAMRSRDRIILIDERGGVYASPEDGHGRLGALGNWPKEPSTDRAIYLLEDARNHLLCALEVVDDPDDPEKKIIIELPFIGEGDAENPFAIMSDERVKEALIRLTEAIEDGGKGGGDGG